MPTLDPLSESRLKGVHPDLVKVVRRAAETCKIKFMVTEGLRTIERERELIAKGFSSLKDPKSCRHCPTNNWGHAVDLAPLDHAGKPTWAHIPPFLTIADAMKSAAAELKVPLRSGCDWKTFKDYPHHELPVKFYP